MNAKPIQEINFVKRNGLIPVIVQDRNTKDILMLAYANREALDCTITVSYTHLTLPTICSV